MSVLGTHEAEHEREKQELAAEELRLREYMRELETAGTWLAALRSELDSARRGLAAIESQPITATTLAGQIAEEDRQRRLIAKRLRVTAIEAEVTRAEDVYASLKKPKAGEDEVTEPGVLRHPR